MKIIRKLLKKSMSNKEYMVIYRKDAFDWDFKYCDEDKMLDFVRDYVPRDLRIFYAKDEIEIDDKIILDKNIEVE